MKRLYVFKLVVMMLSCLTVLFAGGEEDVESSRAFLDSEGKPGVIVEFLEFSKARALNEAIGSWDQQCKLNWLESSGVVRVILADYDSFMCVAFCGYMNPYSGRRNAVLHSLYVDSKTLVPISRDAAWKQESRQLMESIDRQGVSGRGDRAVERESLIPVVTIIDDMDLARVIGLAVQEWDKKKLDSGSMEVCVSLAEYDSYYCVSFVGTEVCKPDENPKNLYRAYVERDDLKVLSVEEVRRKEKENGSSRQGKSGVSRLEE
jgi:hypothetical protein